MRARDRKKLWGRAAGLCAMCKRDVTELGDGPEAHIAARSPGGPRPDPSLTREQLEAYPNKILLCPNCHTVVDNDEQTWTAERLRQVKAAHEEWVRARPEQVSELSGEVLVLAPFSDEVTGADITKPTRVKPGTRVDVYAPGSKRVTGVRIGGDHA